MISAHEKVPRRSRRVDIIAGLAVTLVIAIFFFFPWSFWDAGQGRIYDFALKVRGTPAPPQNIAILAIDDSSIAQIGRWPWPRKRIAEVLDFLSSAGAKLVAVDLFFPKAEGEGQAGDDRLLGEASRRAGNVIYPFYFGFEKASSEGVKKASSPPIHGAELLLFDDPKKFSDFPPPAAREFFAPIPEVITGASALGHINLFPDPDGKVRREPLIIAYGGHYFPAFSLQAAAAALGLSRSGITVNVGRSVRIGNRVLPTGPEGMMWIPYYGGARTFPYYSVADALTGKIPGETFTHKVVFIGVTAAGLSSGVQDFIATPLARQFPGVEKQAQVVAAILEGRLIARPLWAPFLEFGLLCVLGMILTFVLPRLGGIFPAILCLGFLLGLAALTVGALKVGIWVPIFFPALLVISLFVVTLGLRAFSSPALPASREDTTVMAREKVEPLVEEKTARLPAAGSTFPAKLGRYEIIQEIGRGGMGLVYKGRDPIIDRPVAIKTIRFDRFYEGREMRVLQERFFKEAQAAGKLIHPNIVTVFDVGEDGGTAYIAMEYVEGETLAPYIDPDRLLPVKDIAGAMADAALALDFAHQQGIVHRDVKPSNIMRTKKGQVKVMDFGIAKLPSSTLTQTGSILGTPSYMSPEQIHNGDLDGRSDLFSLGCIFYELLTGIKPFQGEDFSSLVHQISEADPLPPSRQNPRVPAACDEIVSKALAKDPGARYASGKEMAEALRRIVHSP